MAGLPWLVTFLIFAAIGMWRGWGWMTILAVFCMGVGAANTGPGQAIYGGVKDGISGAWGALVAMLNSVAS